VVLYIFKWFPHFFERAVQPIVFDPEYQKPPVDPAAQFECRVDDPHAVSKAFRRIDDKHTKINAGAGLSAWIPSW